MIERPKAPSLPRSSENLYDPERDGRIEIEGTPEVIHAIAQQAKNVHEGKEDPNIRPALFILPGGIRGATGGGQVTAIHETGLTDGIKVVIGGSTGAHTAAWLLAGNPRLGTTIFSEECTRPEFIRLKRIPDGYGMDVEFLSQIYRGEVGHKPLDVECIRNAKPDFRIALTEYESGKGVLVDAKKVPTIEAIKASSAAGPLYTEPVYIDDVRYGDASAGAFFPVQEIMQEYQPTHILVLANQPKESEELLSTKMVDSLLSMTLPRAYREGWLSRSKSFKKSLSVLRESGIPHLIIWSDNAVSSLNQNADKIRASASRGEDHLRQLIEANTP